jgi:hypothetical protein
VSPKYSVKKFKYHNKALGNKYGEKYFIPKSGKGRRNNL